jgi:hypothetical protein
VVWGSIPATLDPLFGFAAAVDRRHIDDVNAGGYSSLHGLDAFLIGRRPLYHPDSTTPESNGRNPNASFAEDSVLHTFALFAINR